MAFQKVTKPAYLASIFAMQVKFINIIRNMLQKVTSTTFQNTEKQTTSAMATDLWQQLPAHLHLHIWVGKNYEKLTYWNNFSLIIRSCTKVTVFPFLSGHLCAFFLLCACVSPVCCICIFYLIGAFLCLVIVMACTFETTFKELNFNCIFNIQWNLY